MNYMYSKGYIVFNLPSIPVSLLCQFIHQFIQLRGWSCGAMVLGKLPVLGRPTNLDYSRTRPYCSCSRCRWGLFEHFFSCLSFLFSFSLSLGDGPIQTEILSQRADNPKTTS